MSTSSTQYCVIATIVRSGSTWLCDLLKNNGLGYPAEHFKSSLDAKAFGRAIAKGIPTEKYLEHIVEQEARHGLFITKLFSEWLPLMRAQMETYTVDEAHLLRTLFPSAKYIFLTREDIVAAAISSCLAQQTRKWSQELGDPEVRYQNVDLSPEAIHANVLWQKTCRFRWMELFHLMDIEPLFITYEQLRSEPIATIENISSFLGFAAPKEYTLDTKYKRQSLSYPIRFRQAYDLLLNE